MAVASSAHTQRLHEQRARRAAEPPDVDRTPELAAAYHRLQLHWLTTVPGYRETVRAKLRAAIEANQRSTCSGCGGDLSPDRYTAGCLQCTNRRATRNKRRDVDLIGREVDPCG